MADGGGVSGGLPAAQEFDLHLRLAAAGKRFVHLPEVLYTVRRQERSVSSNTGRTFATHITFLPEIIAGLEVRGELTPPRRAALAQHAAQKGRLCVRYGQAEAGMRLLKLADELDSTAALGAYGPAARWGRRLLGRNAVEGIARLRWWMRTAVSGKSM